MEIKVDVSAETWQKFKMLCTTNKDETAVLTEMVENAWKMAPPEIRKRRGETVDLREEEPKVGLEKETVTAPQPTATEEMPIVEPAVETVTATPEHAVEQPATEEAKPEKEAELEKVTATEETPTA